MSERKPEPLLIDGRYRYTLSSFEPVDLVITVPRVTEGEVDAGVAGVLAEAGLGANETPTDSWVASHVEGIGGIAELRDAVRSQLEALNSQYAEAAKPSMCAAKLAERLEQTVPASEVDRMRESLRDGMELSAAQGGLSLEQALAGMGMAPGDFEQMLDAQALDAAEQEAALDAVAEEYAIYVDETELPGILGLAPRQAQELIAGARAEGKLDDMLAHARHRKAASLVAAECHCKYRHETAGQAQARERETAARRAQWTTPPEGDELGSANENANGHAAESEGGEESNPSRPHLKLV